MRIVLIIALLLIPEFALANSMAPVFPLISSVGWVVLPIIIGLEAVYYHKKRVKNPVRLSVYSNIVSAFIGIFVAALNLPIMLGPAFDAETPKVFYLGMVITVIAIIFHWWLSSTVEYRFSRWHKLWKQSEMRLSLFYKANGITYSIIFFIFAVGYINALVKG